jgi:hypothetical protein
VQDLPWVFVVWLLFATMAYAAIRIVRPSRPRARKFAFIGVLVALPVQLGLLLLFSVLVGLPPLHPVKRAFTDLPDIIAMPMIWSMFILPVPVCASLGWVIGSRGPAE